MAKGPEDVHISGARAQEGLVPRAGLTVPATIAALGLGSQGLISTGVPSGTRPASLVTTALAIRIQP
jgi:hypothetical protein